MCMCVFCVCVCVRACVWVGACLSVCGRLCTIERLCGSPSYGYWKSRQVFSDCSVFTSFPNNGHNIMCSVVRDYFHLSNNVDFHFAIVPLSIAPPQPQVQAYHSLFLVYFHKLVFALNFVSSSLLLFLLLVVFV